MSDQRPFAVVRSKEPRSKLAGRPGKLLTQGMQLRIALRSDWQRRQRIARPHRRCERESQHGGGHC